MSTADEAYHDLVADVVKLSKEAKFENIYKFLDFCEQRLHGEAAATMRDLLTPMATAAILRGVHVADIARVTNLITHLDKRSKQRNVCNMLDRLGYRTYSSLDNNIFRLPFNRLCELHDELLVISTKARLLNIEHEHLSVRVATSLRTTKRRIKEFNTNG